MTEAKDEFRGLPIGETLAEEDDVLIQNVTPLDGAVIVHTGGDNAVGIAVDETVEAINNGGTDGFTTADYRVEVDGDDVTLVARSDAEVTLSADTILDLDTDAV